MKNMKNPMYSDTKQLGNFFFFTGADEQRNSNSKFQKFLTQPCKRMFKKDSV